MISKGVELIMGAKPDFEKNWFHQKYMREYLKDKKRIYRLGESNFNLEFSGMYMERANGFIKSNYRKEHLM